MWCTATDFMLNHRDSTEANLVSRRAPEIGLIGQCLRQLAYGDSLQRDPVYENRA
jgi:hypothetical protein